MVDLENALREAMSSHVADVRAAASLGGSVLRRHRAKIVRFRVVGAAAATAVAAGSVPAYFALTDGPGGNPGVLGGVVGASPSAVPTSVNCKTVAIDTTPQGVKFECEPAPEPTATDAPPQDLGDLGDGREFGGVRFSYLPAGLVWGEWSVKNSFAPKPFTYSTSWNKPHPPDGEYGVQAVVYRDGAVDSIKDRMRGYKAQGAEPIKIHGQTAYIVTTGEAAGEITPKGAPTIVWVEKPGLAVEITANSAYSGELKKIAEGVKDIRAR